MTTRLVLAADVGGTHMRAALVDPRGHVLLRRSAATPGHADVPAALIDLIRAVGAESDSGPVSHAVVGLPGAVDYESGCLLWAPHLPDGWPELLSTTELSAQLDMPAHIANDADLAAVGEAGVLLGGRLMRGRRSLAEVGHTVIDWVAWSDGLPSTLEELGSGSGVARLACEAGVGDVDARVVEVAAADCDPLVTTIWEGAIGACAAGVANLVMSFYPSIVVIGGGLGRLVGFFDPVCASCWPGRNTTPLT